MFLASVAGMLEGTEWPQWRGTNRDGIAAPTASSKPFPKTLKQIWKVEVGEGHSSPIVSGDRAYVFARKGEREVVAAFGVKDGRKLWEQGYPAPYEMNPAAQAHGKGPKSTPVLAGSRIYTLGISGILSCFNAETGKPIWTKDFSQRYKSTSPLYGAAMSPIVDHGLVIAHIGGHDSGAVTAFDTNTGAVKWQWDGDGPAYASPVLADFGGVRQLVTLTQNALLSLGAGDGRLLWKLPLTSPYDQNSVTPLLYKDTIIFSALSNPTKAIRINRKGTSWSPETIWETKQASMYMNSPVLSEGLLFGLSNRNKGEFFCLDPNSGKVLWTSPPRQGENAAIIARDGLIFALKNDAELIVFHSIAKGWDPVGRYTVAASPTWAHPVLIDNQVLVKDQNSLALWGE
jgi:outer membrane protein assembly factor BamB